MLQNQPWFEKKDINSYHLVISGEHLNSGINSFLL